MVEVNYETYIIYFNHHGVASFMILTIVFFRGKVSNTHPAQGLSGY